MDAQDKEVLLRASLGKWVSKADRAKWSQILYLADSLDARAYSIVESRQNFGKLFEYKLAKADVEAHLKTLQQLGYTLKEPQFPELQEFFRDGKPLTAADEFKDALDTIQAVEPTELDWMDELMNNWK